MVPYNAYLLRKFQCHCNIQLACSIKRIKYIYKYIYKGQDKCEAALTENKNGELQLDEIQSYLDARYLCAPEACASLFRFETNRKSHSVQRLPVHLENQQNTVFEENNAEQAVLDGPRPTELTAYFDLNAGVNVTAEARDLANTLLYHDIPQHFIFKNKQWVKRKRPVSEKIKSAWTRNKPIIGRIHNVSQKDAELYALRLLLLHVKGAKSYRALRTVDVHTLNEDGRGGRTRRQWG